MDTTGITRIAHLSDPHILDLRPSRTRAGWSMRTRFLSFGRPLDAVGRRRKLRRSLETARRMQADHVIVSGDLTEIGSPGEYETFAEILHESQIRPDRITLVPGNHDLYSAADGWRWALAGPLAAFAANSSGEPGKVVHDLGFDILPVDTTFHQPVTRSAGCVEGAEFDAIERRAGDPAFAKRPLVLVQHHPPFVRGTSAWHWIDGLIGAPRMMALLESFRHLFVLHGHMHSIVDRALSCGTRRIFGTTAVVDDVAGPRVRMYDVRDGRLEAAGLAA
jgi:3',5'-cyclic AMP phosphodiesterase CpdA